VVGADAELHQGLQVVRLCAGRMTFSGEAASPRRIDKPPRALVPPE
jgi:hypothetical protein